MSLLLAENDNLSPYVILAALFHDIGHLIGFDNGINAYVGKKKTLNNQQAYQNLLENKIIKYKEKIKLLDPNAIDLDYLEEKALDLYGGTEKNAYNIIFKSENFRSNIDNLSSEMKKNEFVVKIINFISSDKNLMLESNIYLDGLLCTYFSFLDFLFLFFFFDLFFFGLIIIVLPIALLLFLGQFLAYSSLLSGQSGKEGSSQR